MSDSSASNPPQPQSHQGAPLRSDGVEARNRLLLAALPLFAAKGFAKTSTREIAKAAGMNLASIAYYFGDKAGLYRAVFTDPRSNPHVLPDADHGAAMELEPLVTLLLQSFVEPLKQDHLIQQCMKLHFREMLEPTGVWQEEVETNIRPAHHALVTVLSRHLGLAAPDDDIHRLAFSIAGLGVMLHIGHDVVGTITPQLLASHVALDIYCERLVGYAMAMIAAEAQRRGIKTISLSPSLNQPKHP
jgi:AcrR family transcriptional regulator